MCRYLSPNYLTASLPSHTDGKQKNTHTYVKIIVEIKESSVWFLRRKTSHDRKITSHKDVLKLPFVE